MNKLTTIVMNGIAESVLNGDTNTAGTGNINSNDQLASTTYPAFASGATPSIRAFDNSLRLVSLAGADGTDKFDIANAALTIDDILEAAGAMRQDSNPSNRIVILDNASYHSLMQDP